MHVLLNAEVKILGGFTSNQSILKLNEYILQVVYSREQNKKDERHFRLRAEALLYRSKADYDNNESNIQAPVVKLVIEKFQENDVISEAAVYALLAEANTEHLAEVIE